MTQQPLINQITLKEFRGIKTSQPINLTKNTVLIGRNNSGKTAILEALFLLPLPTKVPTLDTWRIDLVANLHGGTSSLVYGYAGKAIIKYQTSNHTIELKLSTNGTADITINEKEKFRVSPPLISHSSYMSSLSKIMKINKEELSSSILFIPNDTQFLRNLQAKLIPENEWSRVVKSGANTTAIKELVNPAVHDKYTEAFIERNDIRLRKELPDSKVLYIKITDIGDGIERALTTALWLESHKPKLVLWDDIETAAHPGLIEVLLKWLTNKPWQTVITTHSIDVLDRIVTLQPKNTQIIALQKTPDDTLKTKTLTIDQAEDLLNKNIDIRKVIDLL